MRAESVETIMRTLNEAGVRYLVAGGLAVVAHGYVRFTNDIDIWLDLSRENLHRALEALKGLGYRPVVPVGLEDFADENERRRWIEDKDAKVFMLFSNEHPTANLDILIEDPLDFDRTYTTGLRIEIASGFGTTFVSLKDLLEAKRRSGRPQGLVDFAELAF